MSNPPTLDVKHWERLLSASIEDARTRPKTYDFELSQLYGGVVHGNPELEDIWARLTAPIQARLDIHINGSSVDGHGTSAKHLNAFSTALTNAVSSASKGLADQKHVTNLQLEGVQPGSVRLVFRVPCPTNEEEAGQLPTTEASNIDSQALRAITATLQTANLTNEDTAALLSSLRKLPPKSRAELGKLSHTVSKAGWELDGTLTQRHHQPQILRFANSAAKRLSTAVDESTTYLERSHTTQGVIDGFKRSENTVVIQPHVGASQTLQVTDEDTMEELATLAADKNLEIQVHYTAEEDQATGRIESRRLESFTPLYPEGKQLTCDYTPRP
ncbi:hypothetical protein [Corynebacterium sp. TAE3-ERU2]|uniref:hypothetical protein n=1 Tax=Corynebacterium sp. TAE3-ERU2 TaxID=2849497 RepID=UPI001C462FEE|nr:hypothetical protein [Corynebacterium sp. TAE3-ERU2]MBV7302912.1 hypothetical protein [Corynebacterium sp. TAE3-ERU2]